MCAPRPLLGLLACSLALASCRTSSALRRGELIPPVAGRPARPDVYVQARQAGFVLGGGFHRRSNGIGFTVDVHNRGNTPVVVGISRAILDGTELGGPARFTARIVTGGTGALPLKFDPSRAAIDVTVMPGGRQTLWAVFSEREELDPWREDSRRFRATLRIPTSPGPELVVPVDDARQAPHLERWPLHTGLSFMASVSLFGSGEASETDRHAVLAPMGWGIWHQRPPFMLRFAWSFVNVLETRGERSAEDTATGLSLAATWIPGRSWFGLEVGAGMLLLHGDDTTWADRSPLFTANVGALWALGRIQNVPYSFRMGYQHAFRAPGDRHGLYLSLEVPVTLF